MHGDGTGSAVRRRRDVIVRRLTHQDRRRPHHFLGTKPGDTITVTVGVTQGADQNTLAGPENL